MNSKVYQYRLFLALLLWSVFVLVAAIFSLQQSLWVDESTQLSGLSLSVADLYAWLSGWVDSPFAVPADRMPALSYLVGMVWGSWFGVEPLTMRLLSLTLVAFSLFIFFIFFYRKKQTNILLPALLFLCLSPNLVVMAVEIRAYALFFSLSLIAVMLYVDILQSLEQSKNILAKAIGLAFVLALLINTHFFGLVLTGSLLGAYLLLSFFDRRCIINIPLVSVLFVILTAGLIFALPPIYASLGLSEGREVAADNSWLRPTIQLAYRLVAHQSMLEVIVAPVIVLVLFYTVIVFSLVKRISLVKVALVLVLVLGFAVEFVTNFFVPGINALGFSYNIWMLPLVALLFGMGVSELKPAWRGAIWIVLGLCWGVGGYHLVTTGEKYAHTRFNEIAMRVEQYSPQSKVAVVYNFSMAKTWFAGVYRFDRTVGQYTVAAGEYKALPSQQAISQAEIVSQYDLLIVVYGKDIYSRELAAGAAQSTLPADSPVRQQVTLPPSQWQVLESAAYLAQEAADIIVYKKRR